MRFFSFSSYSMYNLYMKIAFLSTLFNFQYNAISTYVYYLLLHSCNLSNIYCSRLLINKYVSRIVLRPSFAGSPPGGRDGATSFCNIKELRALSSLSFRIPCGACLEQLHLLQAIKLQVCIIFYTRALSFFAFHTLNIFISTLDCLGIS